MATPSPIQTFEYSNVDIYLRDIITNKREIFSLKGSNKISIKTYSVTDTDAMQWFNDCIKIPENLRSY